MCELNKIELNYSVDMFVYFLRFVIIFVHLIFYGFCFLEVYYQFGE